MRFKKCDFCKFDRVEAQTECKSCNFGSNFELKDRLTAREQMEWIKLCGEGSSDKKLVGSIMDGYSYVDTDIANTMQMARDAVVKSVLDGNAVRIGDLKISSDNRGGINCIYEPKITKKEETNMKAIDIYNLTKNNGLAAIVAGGTSIPVRITNVEHETGMYTADTTTLTCEVQHVPAPLARRAAKQHRSDLIKNVYFNNPVTVVIWTDGSKTIVKANGDEPYDPEKGLAMAIAKKFMGDNETKSNYYDVFKKWLPKPKKDPEPIGKVVSVKEEDGGIRVKVELNDSRWKIWLTHIDPKTGEVVGYGVYPTDYSTKYVAERRAKQLWGDDDSVCKWIVSKTNPWETEEK